MPVNLDESESCLPRQPGTLEIHLLNQCNLSCIHCYMDAKPCVDKILPKNLVLRSLGEIEQLGVGTVHLTGGEPFLYPQLPEVLRFFFKQHSFGLTIATNGTLIDQANIDLLIDCGAMVNVSIDGPANYHDKFRGSEGAFRRTSRGIERMLDANIPVSMVTTICQDNLAYLPWFAEWASEMGIKSIIIQPLLQVGRASRIQEKKLSQTQLRDLFFRLSDLVCDYRSKGVSLAMAYQSRDYLLAHPCAAYVCDGSRCHRNVSKEIKKLIIREDGTILPEIETLNPRFSLGNLGDDTLVDLVRRYFETNYSDFNRFCRSVYSEVLPKWASPLIPWDEILSVESWKLNTESKHQATQNY